MNDQRYTRLVQAREPVAQVRHTANLHLTDEEWASLKSEAALQRMQLREYIETIIRERRSIFDHLGIRDKG